MDEGLGPLSLILLNLALNVLAGYTAPLILMAQNRDAERDRLMMQEDFETDRRAAEEIRKIATILEEQGRLLVMLLEQRDRHD